jgi:hypothetical protein
MKSIEESKDQPIYKEKAVWEKIHRGCDMEYISQLSKIEHDQIIDSKLAKIYIKDGKYIAVRKDSSIDIKLKLVLKCGDIIIESKDNYSVYGLMIYCKYKGTKI